LLQSPDISVRTALTATSVRLPSGSSIRRWRVRRRSQLLALSREKSLNHRGHRGTQRGNFPNAILQFRCKKLWGRSSRPLCRCLLQLLNASCCFSSLLSFWLPWIYSPFPFFMEFRNAVLLQLVECILSTQNEVKRKMIETCACNAVPKSRASSRAKKMRESDDVVGRSSFVVGKNRCELPPSTSRHDERPSTNDERPARSRTVAKLAAIYN
jgi:hypothetical protein